MYKRTNFVDGSLVNTRGEKPAICVMPTNFGVGKCMKIVKNKGIAGKEVVCGAEYVKAGKNSRYCPKHTQHHDRNCYPLAQLGPVIRGER